MKHVRKIVMLCCLFCTAVTSISLCLTANHFSGQAVDKMIEDSVDRMIHHVQESIASFNYRNFSLIHVAASLEIMRDPSVPIKTKAEQLFRIRDADKNLIGMNITDLRGNSYLVEGGIYNFSERDYFKNALKGKETIFGPIINKVSKEPTIFYGAPHYDENGNLTNTFFLAVRINYLSALCNRNSLGQVGGASIVKRATGLVIADSDEHADGIMSANIYDDSEESGMEELQRVSDYITAGETGFQIFNAKEGKLILAYAPIQDTDWSVIIRARYSDFSQFLNPQRHFMVIFSIMALAFSTLISFGAGTLILNKIGSQR